MTQKTFTYISKFSYWVFLPTPFFLGIAMYCYLYNAKIAYKARTILEEPYSYYITGILGVLFLLYSLYKLKTYKDSTQNSRTIIIKDNGLVFPHKNASFNIDFKNVSELYIKNSSDDGESLIIYYKIGDKRYEFFHDFFESTEKYLEFKTHIEKYINN